MPWNPPFNIIESVVLPDRTDSYKLGHWSAVVDEATGASSYYESRTGALFPFTEFATLQVKLLRYLHNKPVTQEDVDSTNELSLQHFGYELFNREGWEWIVNEHGGLLPLEIKAVPEGLCIPTGNVLMQVRPTDPKAVWLGQYMESFLTHPWHGSSVATLSRLIKQDIAAALTRTGASLDGLDFMLHDFGYRGSTSDESAAIAGFAHLINFKGTDTFTALRIANDFYGFKGAAGLSVFATEHSLMTQLGDDIALLDGLIADHPTGILSVVADSYNVYNFIEAMIDRREAILNRDGVFVARPDSTTDRHTTPASLIVHLLERLWAGFGGTTNAAGFRTLDPHVRLLWGDGISRKDINAIFIAMETAGFSADNIATFGMGGQLHTSTTRDTQRNAFKLSAQERNGVWHDIFKDPIGGNKTSKKGRLKLIEDAALGYRTVGINEPGDDVMQTVFLDGQVTLAYTLDEVRANAEASSQRFVA